MITTYQLLLTRRCDLHCSYCNTYHQVSREEVEVDLNKLQWVLQKLGGCHIEYSGGEPGLVQNLLDVLAIQPHKTQTIYSNGLVRIKYGNDLQESIQYFEHVTLDENGKFLYQLDPSWFAHGRRIVVVVLTEDVLNAGPFPELYNYSVWYKPITPKVQPVDLVKTKIFLERCLRTPRINSITKRFALKELSRMNNTDKITQCSRLTPHLFIDLENDQIGQCCVDTERCLKVPLTDRNLELAVKQALFYSTALCEQCTRSR